MKRNSVRLAEVWLDDYAQYYYQRIGNEKGDFGDVTDRRELRFVHIPFFALSHTEKRELTYNIRDSEFPHV